MTSDSAASCSGSRERAESAPRRGFFRRRLEVAKVRIGAGGGSRTQTDASIAVENQCPPSLDGVTQTHSSTRRDVERRDPDRHPDRDRLQGAAVVTRLALAELERARVERPRKLLAAALAILDDAGR